MKDQDMPEKTSGTRSRRCPRCEYEVLALFQSADGSKDGVSIGQVIDASHGGFGRFLGTIMGFVGQNALTEHTAPCGRWCSGGSLRYDSAQVCAGLAECNDCQRAKREIDGETK